MSWISVFGGLGGRGRGMTQLVVWCHVSVRCFDVKKSGPLGLGQGGECEWLNRKLFSPSLVFYSLMLFYGYDV